MKVSSILVSVKIWAKTVVLTACFVGSIALCTGEFWGVVMAFAILVGGLILTAPLLLFVDGLVKLSTKLPYRLGARIAWLTFYLVSIIALFYWGLAQIPGGTFINKKGDGLFMATGFTTVSLLLAIFTTRKSLIKLNEVN